MALTLSILEWIIGSIIILFRGKDYEEIGVVVYSEGIIGLARVITHSEVRTLRSEFVWAGEKLIIR